MVLFPRVSFSLEVLGRGYDLIAVTVSCLFTCLFVCLLLFFSAQKLNRDIEKLGTSSDTENFRGRM